MIGIAAKIIEKSMPFRARSDYWQRAMAPTGVGTLLLAPIAVMAVVGWAVGLAATDPAWLYLTIIPFALTFANLGLDDVIKRGRRELRRGLDLTADRICELEKIINHEIQKAYQIAIKTMADRAEAQPDQDREATHLPPPRPRLVAITLSSRLLPIPRAHACHDKRIGRA